LNRENKKQGWLPPSIHRVDQVINFAKEIQNLASVTGLAMELVRKGTQAMDNPLVLGAEYQQVTLASCEGSENLLEKWSRKCAYCGAENFPLQVEHIRLQSDFQSNPGLFQVRSSGSFDVQTKDGKKTVNHRYCRLLQRNDGYEFKLKKSAPNSSPWLKPGVSLGCSLCNFIFQLLDSLKITSTC
jgi:Zn finger protein HypA/HybF involved in hydrogenase expression